MAWLVIPDPSIPFPKNYLGDNNENFEENRAVFNYN
jgi:hypothetical protein